MHLPEPILKQPANQPEVILGLCSKHQYDDISPHAWLWWEYTTLEFIDGLVYIKAYLGTHLRPLASLRTAAPGSTARASSSCTSSSRVFFTVRRPLQAGRHTHKARRSEKLSVCLCEWLTHIAQSHCNFSINTLVCVCVWDITHAFHATSLSKHAVGTSIRPSQKLQHCITLPAYNKDKQIINLKSMLYKHSNTNQCWISLFVQQLLTDCVTFDLRESSITLFT